MKTVGPRRRNPHRTHLLITIILISSSDDIDCRILFGSLDESVEMYFGFQLFSGVAHQWTGHQSPSGQICCLPPRIATENMERLHFSCFFCGSLTNGSCMGICCPCLFGASICIKKTGDLVPPPPMCISSHRCENRLPMMSTNYLFMFGLKIRIMYIISNGTWSITFW